MWYYLAMLFYYIMLLLLQTRQYALVLGHRAHPRQMKVCEDFEHLGLNEKKGMWALLYHLGYHLHYGLQILIISCVGLQIRHNIPQHAVNFFKSNTQDTMWKKNM